MPFFFARKTMVMSALGGIVFLGVIAAEPPENEKPHYKNLKVLAKNIGEDELDDTMDSFNLGLGVTCLFCHVSHDDGGHFTVDYATDSLVHKRVARDMLKMSIRLNRKYFNTPVNGSMTTKGKVWCRTCHRGKPIPIFTNALAK